MHIAAIPPGLAHNPKTLRHNTPAAVTFGVNMKKGAVYVLGGAALLGLGRYSDRLPYVNNYLPGGSWSQPAHHAPYGPNPGSIGRYNFTHQQNLIKSSLDQVLADIQRANVRNTRDWANHIRDNAPSRHTLNENLTTYIHDLLTYAGTCKNQIENEGAYVNLYELSRLTPTNARGIQQLRCAERLGKYKYDLACQLAKELIEMSDDPGANVPEFLSPQNVFWRFLDTLPNDLRGEQLRDKRCRRDTCRQIFLN